MAPTKRIPPYMLIFAARRFGGLGVAAPEVDLGLGDVEAEIGGSEGPRWRTEALRHSYRRSNIGFCGRLMHRESEGRSLGTQCDTARIFRAFVVLVYLISWCRRYGLMREGLPGYR